MSHHLFTTFSILIYLNKHFNKLNKLNKLKNFVLQITHVDNNKWN
jgi:hypothetical protein